MSDQVDLFAVQPLVSIDDYLDEEAFVSHHRALAATVDSIRRSSGSHVPALAVWPEYVATFLMLEGHARAVAGSPTTSQAMKRIVLHEPSSVAGVALRHRVGSATRAALRMLAPRAREICMSTFSQIARDFDLWVVAGSGLFPVEETTRSGEGTKRSSGAVYNTSYTFDPSGALAATTRKVNLVPTQEDILGISAGLAEELEVVETPFGRLGTLICYDGFAVPHTRSEPNWRSCAPVLDELGATVVAQPSANAWAWDGPWAFNEEGEQLRRSEQWFKEGLPAQLAELSSVRFVVNPQLVGSVLDNTFEAPSLILSRDQEGVHVLARSEDPRMEDVLHVRV